MKDVKVKLSPDVAEWLKGQPSDLVDKVLRERMAGVDGLARRLREALAGLDRSLAEKLLGPAPAPAPALPEGLLEQLPPDVRERAAALARYPQLIEAVVGGLVSIERAEAMAEQADEKR